MGVGVGASLVIISFVIVFAWLIMSSVGRVHNEEEVGDGAVFSFLILLLGAIFSDDDFLKISFWFSSGVAFMQIAADLILTEKTLVYATRKNLFCKQIIKTPLWMFLLWWVAATQLCYLCLKLNEVMAFFNIKMNEFSLFMILAFLFFYLFEFIVGNYANWWRRKNCSQPFGVATYAVLAEMITAGMIYASCLAIRHNVEAPVWYQFPIGIFAGSIIAISFTINCFIAYKLYGFKHKTVEI